MRRVVLQTKFDNIKKLSLTYKKLEKHWAHSKWSINIIFINISIMFVL